jgi:hypothetical protein
MAPSIMRSSREKSSEASALSSRSAPGPPAPEQPFHASLAQEVACARQLLLSHPVPLCRFFSACSALAPTGDTLRRRGMLLAGVDCCWRDTPTRLADGPSATLIRDGAPRRFWRSRGAPPRE